MIDAFSVNFYSTFSTRNFLIILTKPQNYQIKNINMQRRTSGRGKILRPLEECHEGDGGGNGKGW